MDGDLANDPEIQQLALQAEVDKNIGRMVDACWDKCIDYADSSLSRKQESCLTNCADRLLDTTTLITQYFNNKFTQGASSSSSSSSSNW